jgi:hypothetical protein
MKSALVEKIKNRVVKSGHSASLSCWVGSDDLCGYVIRHDGKVHSIGEGGCELPFDNAGDLESLSEPELAKILGGLSSDDLEPWLDQVDADPATFGFADPTALIEWARKD